MDNTHIMLMIVIFSIFAICGLVCGLIIHGEAPKYIQEKSIVKKLLGGFDCLISICHII